jgi:hypothetical protein
MQLVKKYIYILSVCLLVNQHATRMRRIILTSVACLAVPYFDIYESNQQGATRLSYFYLLALHVSGDVFAHHQEHLTVFTVLVG